MNDVDLVFAMMADPQVRIWILIATIVLSLPPVFVLFSKRVSGGTKLAWFIHTLIFSWFAYAVFLYRTRKKGNGDPQAGKASG